MRMPAPLLAGKSCRSKGGKPKCKRAHYRQKGAAFALSVRVSRFSCSHRNGFQGVFVTMYTAGPSAESPVAAPLIMLVSPSYRFGDALLPLSS